MLAWRAIRRSSRNRALLAAEMSAMPTSDLSTLPITSFNGGDAGIWQVMAQRTLIGLPLPSFTRLAIGNRPVRPIWSARGFNSNLRYTSASERRDLTANAAPAERGDRCAVLIPISKSPIWWAMAQDERLQIYARSNHMRIGMDVLPAVYRRLYHGRDLGEAFDFLTWFTFAPEAEPAFDAMLARLRASEEWQYVTHECEIRLRR
jgi:hypothetical protein